jgi:hypothetical protein
VIPFLRKGGITVPKELRALLIFVAVVAGYGGFAWLLVRWIHSRLFKRACAGAEALERAGARVLARRRSAGLYQPAQVEFELHGKKARYQVRTYSRDFILQSIRIESPPLPGILVRAERALDRLGKSLGLNREVQLGDASFDDAAYIESSASDEVVRRAFERQEARDHTRELLRLGYRLDLSADGIGASRVRGYYSSFEAEELPGVLRLLEAIGAALPRFDPAQASPPRSRRKWRLFGAGAVALGIAALPMMPLVHPPMDDLHSLRVFGLGLFAWLGVMAVLFALFRGRPTGLRALLFSGLFLIFAVPPVFALGAFAVNAGLDSGPVNTHTARITHLSPRDHEVYFPSWRPGRDRDKVGTSFAVYRTLKMGDTIEIDTRPGALGWTWVPAVRRVP